MKRLFALLIPLVVMLNACQKNTYVVPNRTIVIDLAPSRWAIENDGNYTAEIDMPELTNDFNERGAVLAYISFGDRTYEQLPHVYDGISYTYFTQPGLLVIEREHASGSGTIPALQRPVTVKIVLVESEY